MKWNKIIIVSMSVGLFSGCFSFGAGNTGPSSGGIVRSVDGGISFEERNVITEESTLAKANILSLAIDPKDSAKIYVGTENKGIFMSANQGEKWTQLDFEPRRVDRVVIDPGNTNVLYAAASWNSRGRVFRSADAGVSWDEIYVEPVTGTRVTAITFQPQSSNTIFIGTSINESRNSALVKSVDAGRTWTNVRTNNSSIIDILFDVRNSDQMYMHTSENDILRSNDGGESWESITDLERDEEQETFEGTIYSFFAHERNPGELYLGTDQSLYRSVNYGDSWEEVDIIGSTKGVPIRAISVSPHDNNRLTYASSRAVYVLVGQERWTITDTQSNQAVGLIAYDPINVDTMYIGFYNVR